MSHVIARKFVRWEVKPLESLKREKIYKLAMKVAKRKDLDREDKNEITRLVRGGAKLGGWQFFFPNIRDFYIEFGEEGYTRIERVMGYDKTSVRTVYKDLGRIAHIQERV
jgi:hypothetical protein